MGGGGGQWAVGKFVLFFVLSKGDSCTAAAAVL